MLMVKIIGIGMLLAALTFVVLRRRRGSRRKAS